MSKEYVWQILTRHSALLNIVVLDYIFYMYCLYHILHLNEILFKNLEPIILLLNCLCIQGKLSHINSLSNWWEVLTMLS